MNGIKALPNAPSSTIKRSLWSVWKRSMERAEEKTSLNSPLLQISQGETTETDNGRRSSRNKFVEEVKRQIWLAGPLVSVSLLQFCLQLISVMFVGHLGQLALSGASMATSFASVTGFSLLVCLCYFELCIYICT